MKWMFFLLCLSVNAASAEEIQPHLSSYPKIILELMNHIPRWSPSEEVTPECRQEVTPKACKKGGRLFPVNSMRSKLFFDFDLSPVNGFQKVDFQLTPTLKIRGLLGLHKNQNRPLVIFRMGIHGNRDEYIAERYILKILFEDLGYHVLTLESLTSHGFISSNDKVSFGGIEEGLHTFYILNQIRKKEFSWTSQITTVHIAALSMGGAGAFLTTYLDEQTSQQIQSVVMFCPLVNLQENFRRLSTPGPMNAFADYWNSMRLKAMKDKVPELQKIQMWKMLLDFTPRFAPTILEWLNQNQHEPLLPLAEIEKKFPDVKLPSDFKRHVAASKNYYELNSFWPVFQNKKTPIEVITTGNDLLVLNDINVDWLRLQKFNINYVDLDGFHCSLAEEYQWPFLVETVRRGIEVRR